MRHFLKRTDGGTAVGMAAAVARAGRGSDYRRAAGRMRQLAWRTHLTAADISPPPSRHLPPLIVGIYPLDKFFNIFRRKTF